MRGLALFLILATVLVAGCTRGPVNPYEPSVQANEGALRVVVQDDHYERVANATVLVKPGNVFGTTDAQGIFMAEHLAPGNGTVVVNAPGYSDARRSFVVELGKVAEVVVFVDRIR